MTGGDRDEIPRSICREVLEALDVGIFLTSANGDVLFANDAARAIAGMARIEGNACALLGLRRTPEELASSPKHALAIGEEAIDVELVVRRIEARTDDAFGDSEARWFFLLRDMREEKRRLAEHERFERLALIGTMVAGFAHEVRNPVAALRSLTESLAEDLADANLDLPHVSRMLLVLERVERLVKTSLQFGRPAAPRRGQHRPAMIVALALDELSARVRELGSDVRLEIERDLPDVRVDETQIVQVLVILLSNAIDATGSPSRVTVRVLRPEPSSAFLRVEVRDEGSGITPEILGRIFDPFFTTKASGTGLGLSIAQHIMAENGGVIDVTAPRGGMTTFAVSLPLAREAER